MKHARQYSRVKIALISMLVVLSCFLFAGAAFIYPAVADTSAGDEVSEPVNPANVCTKLFKVNVSVKDGYVFTGVDGSDKKQALGLINIEAVYVEDGYEGEDVPETNVARILAVDSDTGKAETGETVSFTLSGNKLVVTVTANGVSVSGETAVDVSTPRSVNGITATYDGTAINSNYNPNNFNTSFRNRITVYYTYNNGTVDTNPLAPEKFLISGNLFPDPDADLSKATYSKNLTVTTDDSDAFSTEVNVYNITFVPGFTIDYIGGTLATQFARRELSFENNQLYMDVRYGNVRIRDISLAQYGDECFTDVEYYTGYDEENGEEGAPFTDSTLLTTAVNAIRFTFTFPGTTVSEQVKCGITVSPIEIELPTVELNSDISVLSDGSGRRYLMMNYTNDVHVNIGLPSYSQYFQEGLNNNGLPDIEIAVTNGSETTVTAAQLGIFDGTAETLGVNAIEFTAPNSYYTIEFKLKDGGDFRWAQPGPSYVGYRNDAASPITFTVFVDKAFYDLTALNGNFEWTYEPNHNIGTPSITVQNDNAWVGDVDPVFDFDATGSNKDKVVSGSAYEFHLEYYGWTGEDGTVYTADNPSLIAPVNAGRYFVVAVAHENEYYHSARLQTAVDVTVNPKTVTESDIVKSITYDGQNHGTTEFLQNSNNAFYASDLISGKPPITVTAGAGTSLPVKYYQNGGYEVTLTIDDTNYVWDNVPANWTLADLAAKRAKAGVKFAIDKRVIEYDVSQGDFYYGDGSTAAFSAVLKDVSDDKYLTAPDVTYTNGTNSYNDRSLINEWNAGDYTVTYTPEYKGGNDDEEGSLDLKSVTVSFTIAKAQIQKVVINDENGKTYSGGEQAFDFAGWSIGIVNGGLGKYKDIGLSAVRARSVTGKRADVGNVDLTAYAGDDIKLTEADEYTAKAVLLDKQNFEWSDGTDDDITAKWIIDKAQVADAVLPASVVYNHNAREIEFTVWDGEKMKTSAIAGNDANGVNITGGFTVIPVDGDDSGKIALTYAGEYTVTVALKDANNYKWRDNGSSAPLTLAYVLEQATLVLDITESSVDFDENAIYQALPTLISKKAGSTSDETLSAGELTIAFTVEGVIDNNITAADVYTLTVTGISGKEAINYRIPEIAPTYTYTIKSYGLAMPVITDSSIDYDGAAHSFTEFIKDWNDSYVNTANGKAKLVVKVDGDLTIRNAYTYTVYVYPADNYKWNDDVNGYTAGDDGDDMRYYFTYSFTVNRLEAEISWSDTAQTFADTALAPSVAIVNKKNSEGTGVSDDVSIVIRFSADGSLTEVKNAGVYTAYAYDLAGADKGNYKLTKTTNVNYSAQFTITKKTVNIPELADITDRRYGDGKGDVTYATTETSGVWAYLNGIGVTAAVTRTNPWTSGIVGQNDGAFDVASGTFAFTNAGDYYVVFTLTDSNNYCLDSDKANDFTFIGKYSTDSEKFITVQRQELTPPELGGDCGRAYPWGKYSAIDVNSYANVEIKYGQYVYDEIDKTYKINDSNLADSDKGSAAADAIGQYYVRLRVTVADSLNYVWAESSEPVDRSFVLAADSRPYGADMVAIYLSYAITNTQLTVNYTVKNGGYTYGDNGQGGTLTEFSDILKLETDITDAGIDKIEFKDVVFVNENGDTETDFERGLPWNAGKYSLTFTVVFDGGKTYADYHTPLPLQVVVNPRPIEVQWSNLSKIYDGDGLNAFDGVERSLKNYAARPNETKPDKPFLNIGLAGEYPDFPYVGKYNIAVTGIVNGTDFAVNKNYTVVGAKNYDGDGNIITDGVQFVIAPRTVIIAGVTYTGYIYGDVLPSDILWNYADGSAQFVDSAEHIIVKLEKDGKEIAYGGTPDKGTYNIVLAWNDGEADYAKNYNVKFKGNDDNTVATFDVAARQITVELSDINKIYYDEIDYADGWRVTSEKGIVADDNPFAVVAKDGDNEILRDAKANLDGYAIFIAQTDDNYEITIVGKTLTGLEETLTPNSVTETAAKYIVDYADIENVTVTGYDGVYDGSEHALFNLDAEVRNYQAITWQFKTEDGEWTDYTNQTITDVGKFDYYVKVNAANHKEYVYRIDNESQTPVTVQVTAAELVLTVDDNTGNEYKADKYYYLAGNSVTSKTVGDNLANVVWEICEVSSADAPVPAGGWKDYAADGQKDAGNYYFYVRVTADNHSTVVSERAYRLEITQALLTVSVNISIFYGESNPADVKYYMENGGDAFDFKNGYDAGVYFINGLKGEEDYDDIGLSGSFSYGVANYVAGKPVSSNAYAVALTLGLSSRNYGFEAASDMYLTVKPLPVSAKLDKDAYVATYGETPEVPTATVVTDEPSTYGGGVITLLPADCEDNYKNIVTVTTAAIADGKTSGAGLYDVALTLSDNYVWKEGVPAQGNEYTIKDAYTVNKAGNAFISDDYTLFASGATGWTYGDMTADNPLGYDKDGRHKPSELALTFQGGVFKITISRGDVSLTCDVPEGTQDLTNGLNMAFADFYAQKAFDAGEYTVSYYLGESDNYEEFTWSFDFTVGKKTVNVTPDDLRVVYGNPLGGEYTYAMDALAGYGKTDTLADTGVKFAFDSFERAENGKQGYAPGWNAGAYDIKVIVDGNFVAYDDVREYETTNYKFVFGIGSLTVSQREVKIMINPADNHYMLIGFDKEGQSYFVEEWATLDYAIADDSENSTFYGGVPFALRTVALVDELTTLAAGKYAIYAVYGDEAARNNYNIVIANAPYAQGVNTAVLDDENAELIIKKNGELCGGVFTVDPAQLKVEMSDPYYRDETGTADGDELIENGVRYVKYANDDDNRLRYDGKEKYFFAKTDLDRDDIQAPTFAPSYTLDGADCGAPCNAGTYVVHFAANNNANFVELDSFVQTVTISKRSLTAVPSVADGSHLTYNGSAHEVSFTFSDVIGAEVLKLKVTVDGKNFDGGVITNGVTIPTAESNKVLKVSGEDAGVYKITIELADPAGAGYADNANYSLTGDGTDGGVYTYTLTIDKATLYVVVQDATVQYGTQLFDENGVPVSSERINNFGVVYSLTDRNATQNDTGLFDIVYYKNIQDGKFTQKYNYVIRSADGGAYSDGSDGNPSGAGAHFTVTIDNIEANNYNVEIIGGSLTVLRREIEVYVNGYGDNQNIAHNTYDGKNHAGDLGSFRQDYKNNKTVYLSVEDSASTFGNTSDVLADLNVNLRLNGDAIDAKQYSIYAVGESQKGEDKNYAVTFMHGTAALGEHNRPYYEILPAPLTVKVQSAADQSFDNVNEKSAVSVIYGEGTNGLFALRYSGWVNESEGNDRSPVKFGSPNVQFTVGGYVAWDGHVGQTFTVGAENESIIAFTNYKVAFVPAILEVSPRPVTASTRNRIFEADKPNYHGGAWGIAHEASITFDGVPQERITDVYSLSYSTTKDKDLVAANGDAPVKVGDYFVTVSIDHNNVDGDRYCDYVFDNESQSTGEIELGGRALKLAYSVAKRDIQLEWNPNIINKNTPATDKVTMAAFIDSVMDVVSFTRGNDVVDDYVPTDNGLSLNVGSINGTYTVTVKLKDSAIDNYTLGDDKIQVAVSFAVDLDANRSTFIVITAMSGWTYGAAAVNPEANVYAGDRNGVHTQLVGARIVYEYARVISGDKADGSLDSLDGYTWEAWKGYATDAGAYILRARFGGSAADGGYLAANDAYWLFTIDKNVLALPAVTDCVYAEDNGGAGNVSTAVEGYNAAAMQVYRQNVGLHVIDGAMTLFASDANVYTVEIRLIDKNNYEWAGGSTDNVVLTWTVSPANDNTIAWDNNDTVASYNGAADYKMSAYTLYKYHSRITYSFAAREVGELAPADNIVRTPGLPVNAGLYWIFAEGSSDDGNYNTVATYCAFEIEKATLVVRPSGSMTYGNTFDGDGVVKEYAIVSGLVGGDTEFTVSRDIKNVAYDITNKPAQGYWQAADYVMTMTAEAANYVIASQNGTFTVNKAPLSVTLGSNASSLYRHELNVGDTSIAVRGVAGDDVASDIIAELSGKLICKSGNIDITTLNNPNTGTYTVTLSVKEISNYVLSVIDGVYTINKLPVRIEAKWGGYVFDSAPVLPSIVGVYDGNAQLNLTAAELGLFSFVYPDGTSAAPRTAGNYTVSLRIAENSNYTLALPVSGQFVISRIELDAELIVWEQVYYDYRIEKPTVLSIKDNAFSTNLFDISYAGDWNKAGVAYDIVLTLKNPESTKWKTVEGDTRTLTYTVAQGKNTLTQPISVKGWVYGEYSAVNLPTATSKFGTVVFEYASSPDGEYTTAAPVNGDAGTYYVRAVVEGTTDYERFVSPEPVSFEITKKIISAPTLGIITEGYGQNNVYTGTAMQADVADFDSTLMYIYYDDGAMIVNGNTIKVIATNAGEYHVRIALVNPRNYGWATDATLDDDGNASLTWTIARKKLGNLSDNNATFMVNGQELVYYPIGFDSDTMTITGNTSSYGGVFTAVVSIKDPDNYEWANGSTDPIPFEWEVVGIDSVFITVMVVMSALIVTAAVFAGLQLNTYIKKRKQEKTK